MDEPEQQAAEQFSINFQGIATIDVGGKEEKKEITVKHISAFSVYFESEFCPEVTDTVRIDVQLEESEPSFQAVGTVIQVDQLENTYGCTLKFEEVPNF